MLTRFLKNNRAARYELQGAFVAKEVYNYPPFKKGSSLLRHICGLAVDDVPDQGEKSWRPKRGEKRPKLKNVSALRLRISELQKTFKEAKLRETLYIFFFWHQHFPLHTSCKHNPNMITVDKSWVGWALGGKGSWFTLKLLRGECHKTLLVADTFHKPLASGGLYQSANVSLMIMHHDGISRSRSAGWQQAKYKSVRCHVTWKIIAIR